MMCSYIVVLIQTLLWRRYDLMCWTPNHQNYLLLLVVRS
jgi:hypothetical protein